MNTQNQPQFDQTLAVRIVGCSYDGSRKSYSFFTTNPRVKKGDLVIARDKNGFRLVTAQDIVPTESAAAAYANNWIVGRVEEVMEDFVAQLGKLEKVKKDRHRLFMKTMGESLRQRRAADTETTLRHFRQLLDTHTGNHRFAPVMRSSPSKPYFDIMKTLTPTGRIHDEWMMMPFQVQGIQEAMARAGATEFLDDMILTHVNEKGERVLGMPLNPRPGMVLHGINFADLEERVMAAAAGSPGMSLIFSDHIDLVGEEGKVTGYPRSMFTGKLRQILTDRLNNLTKATLTKEDLSDDERPAEGFTIYGEE